MRIVWYQHYCTRLDLSRAVYLDAGVLRTRLCRRVVPTHVVYRLRLSHFFLSPSPGNLYFGPHNAAASGGGIPRALPVPRRPDRQKKGTCSYSTAFNTNSILGLFTLPTNKRHCRGFPQSLLIEPDASKTGIATTAKIALDFLT